MKNSIKRLIVTGFIALALTALAACGATTPAAKVTPEDTKSVHYSVQLTTKQADGYIIPIGKVNIVCIVTDVGMVGCGAFDVMALDAYNYPAVRMKSTDGKPIATIDDLQRGVVKEVNNSAARLGITTGMTGREALDRL